MSLENAASVLGVPAAAAAALGINDAPIEAVIQRLKGQVSAGRLPGFMTCVVKEGKLVHFEADGLSDVCGGVQMKPDLLFRLYSQTKPITVVGALILLERGLLKLVDPVSKYIPIFEKATVGPKRQTPSRPVLVRDLLGHTSGIGFGPGFGYDPEGDYEEAYVDVVKRVDNRAISTLAQWCDEIAKLPLHFHPGKDWGYGYSSDILGRVVEIVSNKPLDVYLQEEVLEPLGMHDTGFAVPPSKVHRLAALYKREPWDGAGKNVKFITTDPGCSGITRDPSKRVFDQASDGDKAVAPSASVFLEGRTNGVIQGGGCVCSVAGGLVSCMRDYLRFGQMLLNGGHLDGFQLLRPETAGLLAKDWLNEFSTEKRKQPLWVWNTPGIGFSPLGQIGVDHPKATGRRGPGMQMHTVHWGGAGGSGYMFNWPHNLQVLTYTGCTYDTETQKALWRSSFTALRQGKAKPVGPRCPGKEVKEDDDGAGDDEGDDEDGTPTSMKRPASRLSFSGPPTRSQNESQAETPTGADRPRRPSFSGPSIQKELPAKRRRTSTGSNVSTPGSAKKKRPAL